MVCETLAPPSTTVSPTEASEAPPMYAFLATPIPPATMAAAAVAEVASVDRRQTRASAV